MHWSNATGGSAWFAFNGSNITYEYTKAYNRGWMSVYIDNTLMSHFNGVDPDNKLWRERRTYPVVNGQHIIEIRGEGGGSTYMDVDAFFVNIDSAGAGTWDDNAPSGDKFVYMGSWFHCTCTNVYLGKHAYNNTLTYSNVKDDAIDFTFYGKSITYVYTKHYNRGYVKVDIDGEAQPHINLYANTPVGGGLFQESTNYPLGASNAIHTIHLAVEGVKDPAASDYYVDLDAFIVQQ